MIDVKIGWILCKLVLVLGTALTELSREKTSQKQVENNTHQFLKSLGSVEAKLTEQINYLTQVSTGMHVYFYICFPVNEIRENFILKIVR